MCVRVYSPVRVEVAVSNCRCPCSTMRPDERGAGPAVALGKVANAHDASDDKKIKKKKKKAKLSDKGTGASASAVGGELRSEAVPDAAKQKTARTSKAAVQSDPGASGKGLPKPEPAASAAAVEGPVAVEDEGPLPETFTELVSANLTPQTHTHTHTHTHSLSLALAISHRLGAAEVDSTRSCAQSHHFSAVIVASQHTQIRTPSFRNQVHTQASHS